MHDRKQLVRFSVQNPRISWKIKWGEMVRGLSHSSTGHQGRLLKGWILLDMA